MPEAEGTTLQYDIDEFGKFAIELRDFDIAQPQRLSRADSALKCVDELSERISEDSDLYCDLSASASFRNLVRRLKGGGLPLTYFAAHCYLAGRLSEGPLM